jgi:glutamate decarboxylase
VIRNHRGENDQTSAAGYAARFDLHEVPTHRLAPDETSPDAAYQLIHDALLLDGSSRLNLATFVTTWMEPQAERLMAEAFDKNSIDKDEYPATAELEARCVRIVADLFHAPDDAIGSSTIGSSEAVMLAGLAMKWRWRDARKAAGAATDRPNLVMSSGVQVVWEKFCRYWDVEPRYIPVTPGACTLDVEAAVAAADENTIGVVAILGTTYTGEFERVRDLNDALVAYREAHDGVDIPIHVDAASGGFVAPFIDPELLWDFRLPQVVSINVSGHKYGLVYPGIGFVIWRHEADLSEDLIFRVSYLGGDMPTFTLNFSRPGNQIIGQYYNLVRLGRSGYTRIMRRLRDLSMRLAKDVDRMPHLDLVTDGHELPVVTVVAADGSPFTVYDVSERLRLGGWQVPAYPLPDGASDVSVLRIVVREGFSEELADALIADLHEAVDYLSAHPPVDSERRTAFDHRA